MKSKKLAVLLAGMLAMTATTGLVGCVPDKGEGNKPSADETTYVKLLHFNAGFGKEYLDKSIALFQEAVKDKEYEPGKKGVYIDVEDSKMDATGEYVLGSLEGSPYDLYISTNVKPSAMKANGNVLDISDLLNSKSTDANPVSEFVEEKSIYERMFSDFQGYYSNTDGTMYGVPVFLLSHHLYYDAELVADRGLYIKDGSTDTNITLTQNLAQAQKGVDGLPGTADDGLPETYAQFYLWLGMVESSNIVPLHYAGKYQEHFTFAMEQFWADFEGKAATKASWTFDGTEMTDLVKEIKSDGSLEYYEPTEITLENGYMVQRQEGRYRVLQMIEKFADTMQTQDKWIHELAFSESETHTGAQGSYLASKYTNKPILMFAEGQYWEAEASSKFEAYESRKGGKLDRKFALLPIPKYSRSDVGENTTMLVFPGSQIFANKHVEGAANEQAVLDFLAFFNRSEHMDMQHNASSSIRPFEYEIDSTVSANMSYYLKNFHATFNSDKTDVVLGVANTDFYRMNYDTLGQYYWVFYSRYKENSDVTNYTPLKLFKDNPTFESNINAETFFEGLERQLTYKATSSSKSNWEEMLGRIN